MIEQEQVIDTTSVITTEQSNGHTRPNRRGDVSSTGDNSYTDFLQRIDTHRTAFLHRKDYQERSHDLLIFATNTDLGNALRMNCRYGHLFHYVADWGVWLVWNGRQWKKDETGCIYEYAKRAVGYITQEAQRARKDDALDNAIAALTAQARESTKAELAELEKLKDERKERDKTSDALKAWSKVSRSKSRLEAMVELLKTEPGITLTSKSLDTNDLLLNFPNGTLHVDSMEFRKHDPFDLITKVTGCEYDPGATLPNWNVFIEKAMCHRPELALYIQKLCGMGLSGIKDTDILPIHYGSGGNGKTVFMEMLKECLGDYAATANTELFLVRQGEHIQNDLARLSGVRFLVASETQDGKQLDESLVKQMTGGDMITARFLRQEFFEFRPKFTANLLTNHKPIIKGTDNGIWRRVKLIPWEHDFEKDITRLDKPVVIAMLRQELSGILNWCLAGYQSRKQEGMKPPIEVEQATMQYRADSDILGQFLQDECIVKPLDRDTYIAKGQLYEAYKKYMEDAGHFSKSANRLSTDMIERGFVEKRTGQARYWMGVRLRDASEKGPDVQEDRVEEDIPELTQDVPQEPGNLYDRAYAILHSLPDERYIVPLPDSTEQRMSGAEFLAFFHTTISIHPEHCQFLIEELEKLTRKEAYHATSNLS